MIQIWSMRINSPADIPSELTGLSFVAPDRVSFKTLDKSGCNQTEHVATTLNEILGSHFGSVFADELYAHITRNESHYMWENRGTEIFSAVTSPCTADLDGLTSDLVVLTGADRCDISRFP